MSSVTSRRQSNTRASSVWSLVLQYGGDALTPDTLAMLAATCSQLYRRIVACDALWQQAYARAFAPITTGSGPRLDGAVRPPADATACCPHGSVDCFVDWCLWADPLAAWSLNAPAAAAEPSTPATATTSTSGTVESTMKQQQQPRQRQRICWYRVYIRRRLVERYWSETAYNEMGDESDEDEYGQVATDDEADAMEKQETEYTLIDRIAASVDDQGAGTIVEQQQQQQHLHMDQVDEDASSDEAEGAETIGSTVNDSIMRRYNMPDDYIRTSTVVDDEDGERTCDDNGLEDEETCLRQLAKDLRPFSARRVNISVCATGASTDACPTGVFSTLSRSVARTLSFYRRMRHPAEAVVASARGILLHHCGANRLFVVEMKSGGITYPLTLPPVTRDALDPASPIQWITEPEKWVADPEDIGTAAELIADGRPERPAEKTTSPGCSGEIAAHNRSLLDQVVAAFMDERFIVVESRQTSHRNRYIWVWRTHTRLPFIARQPATYGQLLAMSDGWLLQWRKRPDQQPGFLLEAMDLDSTSANDARLCKYTCFPIGDCCVLPGHITVRENPTSNDTTACTSTRRRLLVYRLVTTLRDEPHKMLWEVIAFPARATTSTFDDAAPQPQLLVHGRVSVQQVPFGARTLVPLLGDPIEESKSEDFELVESVPEPITPSVDTRDETASIATNTDDPVAWTNAADVHARMLIMAPAYYESPAWVAVHSLRRNRILWERHGDWAKSIPLAELGLVALITFWIPPTQDETQPGDAEDDEDIDNDDDEHAKEEPEADRQVECVQQPQPSLMDETALPEQPDDWQPPGQPSHGLIELVSLADGHTVRRARHQLVSIDGPIIGSLCTGVGQGNRLYTVDLMTGRRLRRINLCSPLLHAHCGSMKLVAEEDKVEGALVDAVASTYYGYRPLKRTGLSVKSEYRVVDVSGL